MHIERTEQNFNVRSKEKETSDINVHKQEIIVMKTKLECFISSFCRKNIMTILNFSFNIIWF